MRVFTVFGESKEVKRWPYSHSLVWVTGKIILTSVTDGKGWEKWKLYDKQHDDCTATKKAWKRLFYLLVQRTVSY